MTTPPPEPIPEQARAITDLPGWPCPPRVADLPDHPRAYGWVSDHQVAVDDEGRLWVNRLATLRPLPVPTCEVLVTWASGEHPNVHVPKSAFHGIRMSLEGLVGAAEAWTPIGGVYSDVPSWI